jgi:hypothetical protein
MCQLLMNRRGARRLALSLALVLVDVLGLGGMVALLMTAMATPALAYVDPSVMTYTIQALAAVAVALSAVLGVAFRRTRKALMKLLHIDENASKTVEPDVHRIDPANKASVDRKAAAQIAAGKAGSASHFTEKDNRPKLRWRSRLGLALLACALSRLHASDCGSARACGSKQAELDLWLDASLARGCGRRRRDHAGFGLRAFGIPRSRLRRASLACGGPLPSLATCRPFG